VDCKARLEAFLRQNQVPFELHHHPRAYTAQEVAATEHVPGRMVAKVVVVWAEGRLSLAVLPAPLRLDLEKAAAALGVRSVRLAREEEFEPFFPDCETGAMPPFGNLYDVPVYVDRSLTEQERVVFDAGTHTDAILMRYADFENLVRPQVADLAIVA
jgi:Ala-tRNA(Pro) deacylase